MVLSTYMINLHGLQLLRDIEALQMRMGSMARTERTQLSELPGLGNEHQKATTMVLIPGPRSRRERMPFGLFLKALGHCLAYLGFKKQRDSLRPVAYEGFFRPSDLELN